MIINDDDDDGDYGDGGHGDDSGYDDDTLTVVMINDFASCLSRTSKAEETACFEKLLSCAQEKGA